MQPLTKFILFFIGAAAIYVVATNNHKTVAENSVSNREVPKREKIAGWDSLQLCSPVQSLNGSKELTFQKDHTVKYIERDSKTFMPVRESAIIGTWTFDESSEKYFLRMSEQQKTYLLIQPENSEVCFLISGTLTAANLNESWFSFPTPDVPDEYIDPPDR